ncbi:hypothetical protein ACLOJK_033838 [Asimina triloba]
MVLHAGKLSFSPVFVFAFAMPFPFSSADPTPSASYPPSQSSTQDSYDGAVERRIREAEDRLREAIEELQQRRQRHARGHHPPCEHADESCVAHAIGNLCQSFLLSYGVRVGIGILLRAFKLARRHSYSSILDLKQLVSEKDLIVREEACRIGLLFGGFTGSYHALRCLLRKLRKEETPMNAILAGSVAGLSILALDDSSRRRTFALYLSARLAQCAYNSAKSKNKFHLWGSHWKHGDSLLFALASAQHFCSALFTDFDFLSVFLLRPPPDASVGRMRKGLVLAVVAFQYCYDGRLLFISVNQIMGGE